MRKSKEQWVEKLTGLRAQAARETRTAEGYEHRATGEHQKLLAEYGAAYRSIVSSLIAQTAPIEARLGLEPGEDVENADSAVTVFVRGIWHDMVERRRRQRSSYR